MFELPLRKWLWKGKEREKNIKCHCGSSTVRLDGNLAICSGCGVRVVCVSSARRGMLLKSARSIGSFEKNVHDADVKDRADHFKSI